MCRQQPTSADREAYDELKSNPPTAATHPNTFAWYVLVNMFTDAVRGTWTGAQAAGAKGGKQAAKPEAKKEEPKKAAKADEDEMDLFGDEEEDEVSFIFNRQSLI